MIGCHSNRRPPSRKAIEAIEPLYAAVLTTEAQHRNGKESLAAGFHHLLEFVKSKKMSYAELVLSL